MKDEGGSKDVSISENRINRLHLIDEEGTEISFSTTEKGLSLGENDDRLESSFDDVEHAKNNLQGMHLCFKSLELRSLLIVYLYSVEDSITLTSYLRIFRETVSSIPVVGLAVIQEDS